MSDEWNLKSSSFSKSTINPLRILWERNQPKANPLKKSIILQSGDPTSFGNFPVYPEAVEALSEALKSDKFSYDTCNGIETARKAVADHCKHMGELTANDVILTTGCSMAIEMCIMTLANPGENILIPRPSWNYTTWTGGPGIEARLYNLDPFNDWNVNLQHMESLIDKNTKAIIVNCPGNPCGNVFSKEHTLEIIAIAERHKLPIISDEIYEFLVFPGEEFHSFATLSKNVPVLVCSGLTKRFSMPGVRCDWIVINDRGNKLSDVRVGLANVSGRNFYPNSTVQKALPRILRCVPKSYFEETRQRVGRHANIANDLLKKIPGLRPIMPKGSMFLMIQIDHTKFPKLPTCLEFFKRLASEQSLFVFPGEVFNFPGYLRIVLTPPDEILIEACNRMREFCEKYYDS